jgi:hypothetical protein
MKVFERITGHPILSAAVQEVVFDTSRVKQMSYEQYFYRLCFDAVLACSTLTKLHNPNQRLDSFIATSGRGHPILFDDLFNEYGNDNFFMEAYSNWKALADYESRVLLMEDKRPPLFYRDLYAGTKSLNRLHSLVISNNVLRTYLAERDTAKSSNSTVDFTGSPSTRSWNLLHLRPLDLSSEDGLLFRSNVS